MSKSKTRHIIAGRTSDSLILAINTKTMKFMWFSSTRQGIEDVLAGVGVNLGSTHSVRQAHIKRLKSYMCVRVIL